MQIGAVKRVRLGELPTPLQEMANLEKVLGDRASSSSEMI